jgi:hypothetical protein
MATKRLPVKDEAGWPYCQWCRKNDVLVAARADELDPKKPGYDTCCPDHHQVWTDDQRLTWDEFCAGEHCRGCGEPFTDPMPWTGSDKSTMHYTDQERAQADAEEARYKARHPDCHAMRHKVSGSLTTHCGRCCPPPPLSPEQFRKVWDMLMSPPAPLASPAPPPAPKPPTRKQLEQRVAELEAEVAHLQGEAQSPS